MNDVSFKKWILGSIASLASAALCYFFKEPVIQFLELKVYVPVYTFPLVVIATLFLLFLVRWCMTFRNSHLKFMRSAITPGTSFGVRNGPSPVTALEWSWLNPAVVIAQTNDGKIIRVHHSLIGLFC